VQQNIDSDHGNDNEAQLSGFFNGHADPIVSEMQDCLRNKCSNNGFMTFWSRVSLTFIASH
jgi:hypothetical protein